MKFRIRIVTFFVPFFLFVTIASAAGPDLDKQEKALNIIADFADRLCKTVPLEGTNQKLELSGGARAELNEVLKKIAELGIEGAAQYQTSEYQGVLRKDLAELLRNNTDCRKQVWTDLKDKLLPSEFTASATSVNAQPLSPEARFIRDNVLALVHELRLVSGKQFRSECMLLSGEQLGPEKPPMALLTSASGKFTIVKSLHPLSNAFTAIDGGFLFRNEPQLGGRVVKPGYERLADEYQSLLGKQWVIAAGRYKDGVPLTGNETFNICAYGLRPIDETAISELLAALDASEQR